VSLMRQFSGVALADRESRSPIMPTGLRDATNHLPEDLAPVRDCGFSYQAHLTRRFRRLVGTTPARFRR
jgi:hypothetical protein